MALEPVLYWGEWYFPTMGKNMSITPDQRETGASADIHKCYAFPDGADVWGISWNSSAKAVDHEVLISLKHLDSAGAARQDLVVTKHLSRARASTHSREIHFRTAFTLAPGDRIWIWMTGISADPDPKPDVEVQSVLWIAEGANAVWVPPM